MSKQRAYYCPVCDGELWPTPCEKWYACPKGCTKLLSIEHCERHCVKDGNGGGLGGCVAAVKQPEMSVQSNKFH